MYTVEARNVEDALIHGLDLLADEGNIRESRNGPVVVLDSPVTTEYWKPRERVLLWESRDANPFFHLFEGLWMLQGCHNVAPLEYYVKRMGSFSDDGITLHGAYGHRWLHHFSVDQLSVISKRLTTNPDDRRCVLQMWDSRVDLDRDGNDVPCNTQAYFTRDAHGALDMTVTCRSNDIIWGAYGANAVHFSMLQEFLAAGIGCKVGYYWQFSNNYHAYLKVFDPLYKKLCVDYPYRRDPSFFEGSSYGQGVVEPYPMVQTDIATWRRDLASFVSVSTRPCEDPFFCDVAIPMASAYSYYREDLLDHALLTMKEVKATDWALAGTQWLQRRADLRDH